VIDLDFTAQFIAKFEGFVDHVYLDAVGVETVGYGETRRDVIERCRKSGISQPDALALLKQRVQEFANAVEACITNSADLTPNRHAALTSFAYNVGVGGFRDSTACKRFNAGDMAGVPEALSWWNKGGGRVLEGLSRRRAAECALFVKDGGGQPSGAQASGAGGAVSAGSIVREGDRGDKVREAQQRLGEHGWPVTVDGIFGPTTTDAVRSFQRQCGLAPDGVLGPATWQRLSSPPAPPPEHRTPECPPWPGRLLKQGVEGDDVRQAQSRFGARGWRVVVDGRFGPKTDATVRSYQTEKALVVDGVIGPTTWQALWTAPITGGGTIP
jgi:GH24 family phage-related lysozyme (muramidase)/peptidoglycan hydrolase-like protein with peptidoglycan-binding domain